MSNAIYPHYTPTKRQYAKSTIDKYLHAVGKDQFEPDMIHDDPSVAVAAEYLGLLDGSDLEYAKTADSIVDSVTLPPVVKVITYRHILESLPEVNPRADD